MAFIFYGELGVDSAGNVDFWIDNGGDRLHFQLSFDALEYLAGGNLPSDRPNAIKTAFIANREAGVRPAVQKILDDGQARIIAADTIRLLLSDFTEEDRDRNWEDPS